MLSFGTFSKWVARKAFCAISDEALWQFEQGTDPNAYSAFVDQLSALTNHFERAMVTFIDHPSFWKVATRFHHADTLPYWRKRKNLGNPVAAVDTLAQRLAGTEGNAALCKSEAGGRSGRVPQLPRTRRPGRAAGDG
jgi:hypothetical protein